MDKEDGLIHEKPAVVLLRHIYEVWPAGTPFAPTSDLIDMLVISHPNVWGKEGPIGRDLTAKRLAACSPEVTRFIRISQTAEALAATTVQRSSNRGFGWE